MASMGMKATVASTSGRSRQLCEHRARRNLPRMATIAPRVSLGRLFFEPIRGPALVICGLVVWIAGASYCHGYQYFLTGEEQGPWSGSLTWSAIAVVPCFALFEWSKEPQGLEATRRPAMLAALVLAIAAFSISLEYLVDFCVGDVTD